MPEILLRRSFPRRRRNLPIGGELAKRFADLLANPFLLLANSAKQICGGVKFRKTEFREASTSFFAPAASKKSNKRTLLCNFDWMRLLSTTSKVGYPTSQTVDQDSGIRQFDESFDQRAQHVSLSSKNLRRQMPQTTAVAVV